MCKVSKVSKTMGLSASQARYLQLTARRSDNEYEAQQINQQRSAIAEKMQEISTKYSNGINNRQLLFMTPTGDGTTTKSVKLTYDTITAEYPNGLGYTLIDANGTPVRPNDKTANAIREKARTDLEAAQAVKSFVVPVDGENGTQVNVPLTGDNYMTLIGNTDTVLNRKGEAVSSETLQASIKGMSSQELNQYWKNMGYSFLSETKLGEIGDEEKVAEALKNYQAAMKEAEEIENQPCIYDDRCRNSEYLESQLRSGNWTLERLSDTVVDEFGNYQMEKVHYSGVGLIADTLDTSDDAAVTAEYEQKSDFYEMKDKQLELELQRLQTSHTAIQTEIDSVQKVIDKNVEKSFKTFG